MPRKSSTTGQPIAVVAIEARQPKPLLHAQLLEGLTHKSRADGSVHTISAAGRTVAEICVGKKFTRLNMRAEIKAPKGLVLSGKSKSWKGGGIVVLDANVVACRALLDSSVQNAQRLQGASDVAADLAARKTVKIDIRKRVAAAAKTGVKVTA